MAVKTRDGGKYDVELRGKHVKRVYDSDVAMQLYYSGKRMLELGKPLGTVIAELRGESTDVPTLAEYFECWLPLHSIEPQSVSVYRNDFNRAGKHIGSLRLDAIDTKVLKLLVSQLTADGYAPYTINRTVQRMKCILNDACDDKLITDRPARHIKNLPTAKATKQPYALTHEQHRAIVKAAPELYKPLFELWPLIGGRRGEMAALRWEDRENGGIWIRKQLTNTRKLKPPKYGSVRFVDLGPKANRLLDEWSEVNPSYVIFPGVSGGMMGWTHLEKAVKKSGQAAKVDLHTHIFRHTAGSWWIASRCFSLPMVARMMGHRVEELVSTYTHEIEEADAGAIERYDGWLSDTEGTETTNRSSDPSE